MDYKYLCTPVRVVDGDTIYLDIKLGFGVSTRQRIRLMEIDTPEIHGVKKTSAEYRRGMAAKRYLESLVWKYTEDGDLFNMVITTYKDKKRKYGRYLGVLSYHDENANCVNVNEEMIKSGHAKEVKY